MSSESNPLVSVVVTTKNEERNIETCLRSLLVQTYAPIEIIVVDNSSTDRTKEIARSLTDKVFDRGPQRGAQANYGMLTVAGGPYVMYVDADMVLSPGLIEACVGRMSREDCVALQISEIILGRRFLSRVRRFERSFYDGTVIDAARFFRSDALRRVGGFDESLNMVDDWDLDKKVRQIGPIVLLSADADASTDGRGWELAPFIQQRGVNAYAHRTVVFHNESDFRLGLYLRKKNYYANWLSAYERKWRNDPDVRRQLGFRYRYFGVFLENGHWRRLVRHPLLTAGMYFLRLAVGGVYLSKKLRSNTGQATTPG